MTWGDRRRAGLVVSLILMAAPAPARAAMTCAVSATPVAFGGFAPLSGSPADSTGDIGVACTWDGLGSPTVSYAISLSAGGSAAGFSPRRMSAGAFSIDYNLYGNSGFTVIWGDGTGGTQTVNGAWTLAAPNAQEVRHETVYGRIAGAQQTAHIGAYSDTITVTVAY